MKNIAGSLNIPVVLSGKQSISLTIYEETANTLYLISEAEAREYGESPYQLVEGKSYEYELPEDYSLETSEIVSQSRIHKNSGRISTNIFVGTFSVNIYRANTCAGKIQLEIRSAKTNYRTDYRIMLEEIATKCTDLLMQQSAMVNQHFTVDIFSNPQTLYQRFSFIRAIIDSDDFNDAMHQIHVSPVKRWKNTETSSNVCNLRKINQQITRQLITNKNRVQLPDAYPLRKVLNSVPDKIIVPAKEETVDTPENRFVKHTLETYLQFCISILQHPNAGERLKRDAEAICEKLNNFLSFSFFKEVSRPTVLPLNSPVLQRKEGYREILQTWFMYDMAARLIWSGGENVYAGGKRDVATLYEYWLFFKLLEILENLFQIKPKSVNDLIEQTNNGLELRLKQGRAKVIEGIYETKHRKLHIEFCYNKTFSCTDNYPKAGSWTKNMRPDYTLSVWPEGITCQEAEQQEIIVHIHFDAKYRIDNYDSLFMEIDPDEEKADQAKGNYKRADLLKMHAYKDAIRRTAGAYILYPGTGGKQFHNFHEVLPGLGAFAISPSKTNEGINGLKEFLHDIITHFLNRASQREKIAYHTYETFKEEQQSVQERLPEPYKTKRDLIPDNTFVLVGYYKDQKHLDWILKNGLYNTRTETKRGSLRLSKETTSAKYLLLHGENDTLTGRIYKLDPEGPRVLSKEKLVSLNYPASPSQLYYIVYKITNELEEEFENMKWDISNLKNYQDKRNSALPFSTSLTELMQVKVK